MSAVIVNSLHKFWVIVLLTADRTTCLYIFVVVITWYSNLIYVANSIFLSVVSYFFFLYSVSWDCLVNGVIFTKNCISYEIYVLFSFAQFLDVLNQRRNERDIRVCLHILVTCQFFFHIVNQCFSTFLIPRPGKFFFFIKRGPGPNKFTR
jgi:hypothetical protein